MSDDIYDATGIEGFGVSADGTMVAITLGAKQGGGRIEMRMPAEKLPEFHAHLGELIHQLQAAELLPAPGRAAGAVARGVKHWMVGRPDDPAVTKTTALMFDEGMPSELLLLMADIDVLKLADAIEQQVFKNMTGAEQRRLLETVEKDKAKSKLILPPGMKRSN